jgi:hypothetical protein
VTVPVPPDLTRWSGQELALTAELALATSTSWGPEGHVVARHQFELPAETAPRRHGAVTTGSAEVLCERMDDRWSLGDGSWGLDVDRHLGVVGLSRSGHPLLVNRPGHSLWRAPIDNDGMKTAWMSGFGHQDRWRQVGLDSVDGPQTRRLDRVTVRRREDGVAAVLTGVLVPRRQDGGDGPEPPECPITERWWLRGDGTISIDVTWRLPEELADPPRIGLVLALDPSFDQLESSGLGPHECPPDRIEGAVLGRYRRRASEERCPLCRSSVLRSTRWHPLVVSCCTRPGDVDHHRRATVRTHRPPLFRGPTHPGPPRRCARSGELGVRTSRCSPSWRRHRLLRSGHGRPSPHRGRHPPSGSHPELDRLRDRPVVTAEAVAEDTLVASARSGTMGEHEPI